MMAWYNVSLLVEVKPAKKFWWAKWDKIGSKIRFVIIFLKFGPLVFLEIA